MSTGASRFAQQMLDKAAADFPELPVATVTGYTGPGSLVIVNYLGATLHLRRLSNYTPSVGDPVVLARAGGTWLILGSPVP